MRTRHDELNDSMMIIESYSQATASMMREVRSLSKGQCDTLRARIKAMADALDRYEVLASN